MEGRFLFASSRESERIGSSAIDTLLSWMDAAAKRKIGSHADGTETSRSLILISVTARGLEDFNKKNRKRDTARERDLLFMKTNARVLMADVGETGSEEQRPLCWRRGLIARLQPTPQIKPQARHQLCDHHHLQGLTSYPAFVCPSIVLVLILHRHISVSRLVLYIFGGVESSNRKDVKSVEW